MNPFSPILERLFQKRWLFRRIHNAEMRRGSRSLPVFFMRMLDDEQAQSSTNECDLSDREITFAFEQPRWLAWLDRVAEKRS